MGPCCARHRIRGGEVLSPTSGQAGIFLFVMGYVDRKTGKAMSKAGENLQPKVLQKALSVSVPFDTWVHEKLTGSGRVGVCLAKGESGHYNSSQVVSNIAEIEASFAP